LPKLLAYPLKVVWQWLFLSWAFFYLIFANRFIPSAILVQNPPAIPTLGLCWAYSKIFRCPFIIDWHNYGFSIMSLKTSPEHPIVRFAKWFEDYFGSRGDSHICVTRAMKDDLKIRLNIE
jgi:beta-1,4-mannosyltransferase